MQQRAEALLPLMGQCLEAMEVPHLAREFSRSRNSRVTLYVQL